MWKKVPAEQVVEVERITGLPREELRPDLYRGAELEAAQDPDCDYQPRAA